MNNEMSNTEIKWRIKILRNDKQRADMSKVCECDLVLPSSLNLNDCRSMSGECKTTNSPKINTCQSCCCSVCNRSSAVCHDHGGEPSSERNYLRGSKRGIMRKKKKKSKKERMEEDSRIAHKVYDVDFDHKSYKTP